MRQTITLFLLLAGMAVAGCKKEISTEQRVESLVIGAAMTSYELGKRSGLLARQMVEQSGREYCSVDEMLALADSISRFYERYDTTKILKVEDGK